MNNWQSKIRIALSCVLGFGSVTGCQEKTPPAPTNQARNSAPIAPEKPATAAQPTEEPAAKIAAPRGQLLYQPIFHWSDGDESAQGTGFFAKAPNGKIAAVTSAHFIDPERPALLSAEWQTIDGEKIVAKLSTSWGPPGKLGGSELDQRSDYLLFPVEPEVMVPQVLEFDPRPRCEDGELVWFVDKDGSESAADQRVLTGRVKLESPLAIILTLDDPIKLQSQSGSPFISQKTGKVIGLLCSGGHDGDELLLIAAPVGRMLKQLQDDSSFPELRTVIGKETPPADPKTPAEKP